MFTPSYSSSGDQLSAQKEHKHLDRNNKFPNIVHCNTGSEINNCTHIHSNAVKIIICMLGAPSDFVTYKSEKVVFKC